MRVFAMYINCLYSFTDTLPYCFSSNVLPEVQRRSETKDGYKKDEQRFSVISENSRFSKCIGIQVTRTYTLNSYLFDAQRHAIQEDATDTAT